MVCFCQPSIKRTESQISFLSSPSQKTINYTITNSSKDTIYIWLQNSSIVNHSDNSFRRYFFSNAVPLPLYMLCFDGNVYFDEPFVPVLGANFIKRLTPDESFNIYLLNCDMDLSAIQYEMIDNIKKLVSPEKLNGFDYYYNYVVIDDIKGCNLAPAMQKSTVPSN